MIILGLPQKRAQTAELLEGLVLEGITFKVEEVKGINITISSDGDEEQSLSLLKPFLKSELGPAIYFNIKIA